jgi:hypothetical protein
MLAGASSPFRGSITPMEIMTTAYSPDAQVCILSVGTVVLTASIELDAYPNLVH